MTQIILRLSTVKNRTGLGRSTIYKKISNGTFPKPIAIGKRAVGWLESDIENWISQCVEESHQFDLFDQEVQS